MPSVVYTMDIPEEEPQVVLIEALPIEEIDPNIDWTVERVKEYINRAFPDSPVMLEVARCESGFKPSAFNPTNNSDDKGIFQISTYYHGSRVEELELDMYKVTDNITFARILYDEQGLQPWSASKRCWSHAI